MPIIKQLPEIDDIDKLIGKKSLVVVSTYASVHKFKKIYNQIDFVILDECHNAFSPKRIFL